MSDRPGFRSGGELQALDSDVQSLIVAVNRIGQLLKPPAPQVVNGSRSSGAALTSLLAALVANGVIIDNTTP